MYIFGVDIGGTSVKMGFFTGDGKLLDKWEIPTNKAENGKHVLPDIANAITKKIAQEGITAADVTGIGVGVPGPVLSNGIVNKCVNLGWGIFDIEETMRELTGIPCKAGNDANVAALGEVFCGGAKGFDDAVMLTLGTGVGGGVVLDGQIWSGTNGAAGEIGHIPMNPDETESCGCGKKGCLEQYASATGIARLGRMAVAKEGAESSLKELANITAKDVLDAAKAGDAVALEVLEKVGEMLGRACASISCVIDPQVYIIGGGVSKAGSIITDTISKYYKQDAFHASRKTKFVIASLGNDAGIYGCVRMVMLMMGL